MNSVYQFAICAACLGGTAYQWYHIGRNTGKAKAQKFLLTRAGELIHSPAANAYDSGLRHVVAAELLDASEEIGRGG